MPVFLSNKCHLRRKGKDEEEWNDIFLFDLIFCCVSFEKKSQRYKEGKRGAEIMKRQENEYVSVCLEILAGVGGENRI